MSAHDEKQDRTEGAKLNRRSFIGALGAAAAAGALLESIGRADAKAQSQPTVWYQDSFGNVVPAGAGTLALGIMPPPLPPNAQIPGGQQQTTSHKGPHGPQGPVRTDAVEGERRHPHGRIRPETGGGSECTAAPTYYSPTYPKYNVLMIMVDQMRNPYFWPPTSGSAIGSGGPIPNISGLMEISNSAAWQMFFNYYLWMESCVDIQVGRVLTGLADSAFASNTVIIFTSDHGNVPLMISYPGQASSATLPFTCSSVDILPFIYSLALGNDSWRGYPSDIVYYLNQREAINDAIYEYQEDSGSELVPQRRLSSIRLSCELGDGSQLWEIYQPFVLHTADDYSAAYIIGADGPTSEPQPSHAIAFRTVDQTTTPSFSNGANMYGGGKLGFYSYWDTCDATDGAPIMPKSTTNGDTAPDAQFEFYNYSPGQAIPSDPFETGNWYLDTAESGPPYPVSALATAYSNNFFNIDQSGETTDVQSELYSLNVPCSAGAPTQQVLAAIPLAFSNYLNYLQCTQQLTNSSGAPVQPSTPAGACADPNECATCLESVTCPNYEGQP